MKEFQISDKALAVLTACTQEGQVVRITGGQLDRRLYEEVDKVMQAIGGKWNRAKKGHVFEEPEKDVADLLEGCIQTGIATPLRPEGFFETPPAIVELLLEKAELKPGMWVLEPSAGKGAIVRALLRAHCLVDAVEIDPRLARDLRHFNPSHDLNVNENDFLMLQPLFEPNYDRIVMNPPFARLADVNHVTHAWKFLKPGGKLVSVMSASVEFHSAKKAAAFREFAASHGKMERLPDESFKESGTLIKTIIAILNKSS